MSCGGGLQALEGMCSLSRESTCCSSMGRVLLPNTDTRLAAPCLWHNAILIAVSVDTQGFPWRFDESGLVGRLGWARDTTQLLLLHEPFIDINEILHIFRWKYLFEVMQIPFSTPQVFLTW